MNFQKLTFPHKDCFQMLCGYKNVEYRKYWGYNHFGVDISALQGGQIGSNIIVGSGEGMVLDLGWDNSGGNVLIILYPKVYNHRTGEIYDLVARYMHLEEILVKKGEKVTRGMPIALEGKTKTKDYHLHIEFDKDTRNPRYSPQVSSRDDRQPKEKGNLLLHGYTDSRDTSVNPSDLFYIGEEQTLANPTYNPAWLNKTDFKFPTFKDYKEETNNDNLVTNDYKLELDKYKSAFKEIEQIINSLK